MTTLYIITSIPETEILDKIAKNTRGGIALIGHKNIAWLRVE